MPYKNRLATLAALILILSGCQSEQRKQAVVSGPITDFLKQVKEANAGRSLQKHVVQIGGWQEQKFIKKANAAHELALIDKADLSYTALQANYRRQTLNGEELYQCQDPRLETQSLRIMRDNSQRIIGITAKMRQQNYLYEQSNTGVLGVRYDGDRPLITQSTFTGSQKMIVGQEFKYAINQIWK